MGVFKQSRIHIINTTTTTAPNKKGEGSMGAMLAFAWFYISSIFINDRQHDDKDVSSTESGCHIAVKRSTGSCPAYLGEKNLVFFPRELNLKLSTLAILGN